MFRFATALLLVVFLLPGGALAGDPTMLYAIEDKGRDGRVFLLGSIHVGQADSYPLDATLEEAYELSDGLAVEVDIAALSPQQSMDMLGAMMLPPEESLSAQVDPVVWQKLVATLGPMGLPADAIDRMRPWAVAMMAVEFQLAARDYLPDHGLDRYFLDRAHADASKTVIALESVELQMGVFGDLSPEAQLLMLKESLEEDPVVMVEDVWSRWLVGDADGIFTNMVAPDPADGDAGKEIHAALFDARHLGMVRGIEGLMNQGGTWFVVVGAGHLVGDGGLVAMLGERGARTTQLKSGGLPKKLKKRKKAKKKAA